MTDKFALNIVRQYVNELNISLKQDSIKFYETEFDNEGISFSTIVDNQYIENEQDIVFKESLKYTFEDHLGYKCIWSKDYRKVKVIINELLV